MKQILQKVDVSRYHQRVLFDHSFYVSLIMRQLDEECKSKELTKSDNRRTVISTAYATMHNHNSSSQFLILLLSSSDSIQV